MEFFNYSNQKKLNSIEKYIIDLKDNIDNLENKVEKNIIFFLEFYDKLIYYYEEFNNIGINEKNKIMRYTNKKIVSDYKILFNKKNLDNLTIKILFNYLNISDRIKVIIYNNMY